MKYKTFVALRAGVATLVLAGIGFVGCRAVTAPSTEPPTQAATASSIGDSYTEQAVETAQTRRPAPQAKPDKPNKPQASTQQAGTQTNELTTWQREVMEMQKQPLTNGEVKSGSRKWVVNGGGMRAEFRSDLDKGFDYWNRVKVDVNLNKRYEERWDFKKDGSIKRRVSPNDDENYTEEYRLQGERWVKKG